jgi:hypothetical protein
MESMDLLKAITLLVKGHDLEYMGLLLVLVI